jgi:hypothetical protein
MCWRYGSAEHHAPAGDSTPWDLTAARAEQAGRRRYRIRHACYLGRPKTRLEHNTAAAAINLIRLDAWWTGKPLDRTRTTHLQRLDLAA